MHTVNLLMQQTQEVALPVDNNETASMHSTEDTAIQPAQSVVDNTVDVPMHSPNDTAIQPAQSVVDETATAPNDNTAKLATSTSNERAAVLVDVVLEDFQFMVVGHRTTEEMAIGQPQHSSTGTAAEPVQNTDQNTVKQLSLETSAEIQVQHTKETAGASRARPAKNDTFAPWNLRSPQTISYADCTLPEKKSKRRNTFDVKNKQESLHAGKRSCPQGLITYS